jgi:hypothetical protein
MERSTQFKIIAVIAVLAGPFLTYNGHQEKERLAKLEKEGVTVDGIIEGGEWRKGKRSSDYKFDVSFTPQGGAPIKQTFRVTSDFFSAHANDNAVTDPAVKVRYLAGKTDSAIVVGGSTDTTVNFPVGIGAFVIGLLTLGVMQVFKW